MTIDRATQADRLRKVAYLIDEHRQQFDMTDWLVTANDDEDFVDDIPASALGGCGTFGCIAGWTAHLEWIETGEDIIVDIPNRAGEYLGLSYHEREHLFYGTWHPDGLYEVQPEEAIKHLLGLADKAEALDMERALALALDDPEAVRLVDRKPLT